MNLGDWRRRIDEIDQKLVELLNERSRCALEIGKLKQAANLPLYQPDRENEVLANAERANPETRDTDGAVVKRQEVLAGSFRVRKSARKELLYVVQ